MTRWRRRPRRFARDSDIILDIFMVERDAQQRGVIGTPEHLALRQTRSSRQCLSGCASGATSWRRSSSPKSPMGAALRYMVSNQWERLKAFLLDPGLVP